jgi:putative PIG3 family NAD(P)H quinone oxidoreductase
MNTMTAIKLHAFGGPDCLCPSQMDRPQPGMGEVLIRVEAAGVNRPDIMQRKGLYPPPPGASDILGLEVAGTVAAVGEQVSSPRVGDDVCALVTGGGYAEYCIAAAPLCLPIPGGLNYIQAASLPETFFTVWTNVFERGKLQAWDSILIHGGTSGIGVAAIQLARCFGSKVFTTAGTEEKCRFCADLGALAINYHEQDFAASILELTDNRGVDVILDMVGGDYLQRNLSCLAMEGRLVQIAVMNGPKANINLATIMLKRLTLTGSTLRPRGVDEKARIARALLAQVWPLLESGEIKPIVHAVFKLEKAADAHSLMESGRHIGKIILTTGS